MTAVVRRGQVLTDVIMFERPTFADARGFFKETFRLDEIEAAVGRPLRFVQGNHSRSKRNVLRGVHVANYDKLITVPRGDVFALIVDLRPTSPTFKRFEQLTIGESNRVTVFVPAGFGNAYCALSDEADYHYLVTAYYGEGKEDTVRWDDPALQLPWPHRQPIISERDRSAKTVQDLFGA